MDVKMQECINTIYDSIYCKFKNQYIIVFLCGGASGKNFKSMRDKLKKQLDTPHKYRVPMRVFYPEDLLMDAFNKSKGADLLSYEQFLADNSDVIVIVCESPGSLVELGAFVNNEYTTDKVIALIDKKHSKDQSFIMNGPIKFLNKKGKYNVLPYLPKDERTTFIDTYDKIISKTGFSRKASLPNMRLNTIVGLHYFVQLLLYFYKELSSTDLSEMVKWLLEKEKINIEDFDLLFQSSIKLLLLENSIIKSISDKVSLYSLSESGYSSIVGLINKCITSNMCDKIRIDIMYADYYKAPHS